MESSLPKKEVDVFSTFLHVVGIGVLVLVVWWWFFSGSESHSNTIQVDCRDPQAKQYNRYCNGDWEAQIQEEDYRENSYYQNHVR